MPADKIMFYLFEANVALLVNTKLRMVWILRNHDSTHDFWLWRDAITEFTWVVDAHFWHCYWRFDVLSWAHITILFFV